jgi:hypothetical protein
MEPSQRLFSQFLAESVRKIGRYWIMKKESRVEAAFMAR